MAVQRELIKGQKQLATLQSENAGLKSRSSYAEQRAKKLETQVFLIEKSFIGVAFHCSCLSLGS